MGKVGQFKNDNSFNIQREKQVGKSEQIQSNDKAIQLQNNLGNKALVQMMSKVDKKPQENSFSDLVQRISSEEDGTMQMIKSDVSAGYQGAKLGAISSGEKTLGGKAPSGVGWNDSRNTGKYNKKNTEGKTKETYEHEEFEDSATDHAERHSWANGKDKIKTQFDLYVADYEKSLLVLGPVPATLL